MLHFERAKKFRLSGCFISQMKMKVKGVDAAPIKVKRGNSMSRLLLKFVTAIALCSILLALSSVSFAQRRGPYARAAYTREDVNSLIRRVEERSDAFVAITGLNHADRA
jgi:hypothetical protein